MSCIISSEMLQTDRPLLGMEMPEQVVSAGQDIRDKEARHVTFGMAAEPHQPL